MPMIGTLFHSGDARALSTVQGKTETLQRAFFKTSDMLVMPNFHKTSFFILRTARFSAHARPEERTFLAAGLRPGGDLGQYT